MRPCSAVAVVGHSCHGGCVLARANRRRSVVVLTFVMTALSELSCRQIVGITARQDPLCRDELMIDSLEDGDAAICNVGERHGFWYTFGDKSNTDFTPPEGPLFTPTEIPGGRSGSKYAARFKGSGFTTWGGGMGLTLNGKGLGTGAPYPADSTAGIKFWMKASVPVSVRFPIRETIPPIRGGECVDTATTYNCDNHFQFQISPPNADQWVEYEVPYESLKQPKSDPTNGNPIFGSAILNTSRLIQIDFGVEAGMPFDVWIDDVRFYQGCPGATCLPTCTSPTAAVTLCPAEDELPAACRPVGMSCPTSVSTCDPLMIDDLEDRDTALCKVSGRRGYWYTASDSTGTLEQANFAPSLIPEGRGASLYAARFSGSGFTDWGAEMGLHLNEQGRTAQPYNLGPSGAIKFWMKSNAPVSVKFPMLETTQIISGGTCVGDFDNGCDDHFHFEVAAPTTDDWAEYTVPFDALARTGNAGSVTWDSSRVTGLIFGVAGGPAFDVWVDDIRLVDCSLPGSCLPTCGDPAVTVFCPTDGDSPARCVSTAIGCSGSVSYLFDVWGTDPEDVWVTGERGTVAHWDGSSWSALVATPTTERLQCVWGSAPDDVWAVGYAGAIVHWNGSFWSPFTSGTTNRLESVWGTGPRDVWAIGENGTIVHWNGFAWSTFASGTTDFFIGNAWGSGPADVWAVGGGGIVSHWDGAAWSPSRIDGIGVLLGLWGSGPEDVWAVGGAAVAMAVPDQQIVRWNGSAWTKISSGTTELLFGVWGSGPNDVWAVGDAGTIIHWTGTAWSASDSGTTEDLRDVWGSGPNDIWVVGQNGTLLHGDGTAWSRRSIPRK